MQRLIKLTTGGSKTERWKSNVSINDFASDDYVGCDGRCDFTFLQTSLNLKNSSTVKEVYHVKKQLGSGSFGKVYLAKHKMNSQKRAIKLIYKHHTSVREQKKIENEMNLLQQLFHPNILQLVEYFETTREVYLVTDVYEGGELFDEIIRRKEFSEADAATIIKQLLSCLSYLNKKNVVHRDIKPENIMLEKTKDLTAIKLIDFGHATKYNPERDGFLKEQYGTPYYMSPEVLNSTYDDRCDIWSIGVISYILMAGYPPFNGANNSQIFEKTKRGVISFARQPWPSVSDTSKDFVTQILTHDFKKRQRAQDLLTHEFFQLAETIKPQKKMRSRRGSRNISKARLSSAESGNESKGVLSKFIPSRQKPQRQKSSPAAELKRDQNAAINNLRRFRCKQKFKQVVYAYIIAQCLPKEKREELARVFKAWDKDNNGVLSREEIENALKTNCCIFQSTVQWKGVFDLIDQDGSGYVEYHEFLVAATDPKVLMTTSNLESVFKVLDQDGNGYISLEELRAAIKDDDVLDDVVQDIMNEMDKDKDGQISLQEFLVIAEDR